MKETVSFIKSGLQNLYTATEIRELTSLILESVCRLDRTAVLLRKDTQLSSNEKNRIAEIVAELQKRRPIQYILGETEFYGLTFKVNENVLIPRPETEELVDWIVRSETSPKMILDFGTGSGCIAIALAKRFCEAEVFGLDFSENAIAAAKENAEKNRVKTHFLKFDILNDCISDCFGENPDLIVSNPPYVVPSEKAAMERNVLDFEPHSALFVPEEQPLLFYERIADIALQMLNRGGKLYFETNAHFARQTAEMLENKGFINVELRRDLAGKERLLRGEKP
ncbi:MAG: peptide chain release factor N(5)-glutamine methyltransferase [Dysgonamonadaceae bacterium]|jgi:release factor glutamine methyltransferase|nr:peptide chain release factor N(5)-glutamine methyltransferase [Dysgonamonadaceae bacterium]